MLLCPLAGPLELDNHCVRQAWATFVPVVLVALYVLIYLLHTGCSVVGRASIASNGSEPFKLNGAINTLKRIFPLTSFLTLEDAHALDRDSSEISVENTDSQGKDDIRQLRHPLWFTSSIVVLSLVECGLWLAYGAYNLALSLHSPTAPTDKDVLRLEVLRSSLIAFTWLYAALNSVFFFRSTRKVKPPYNLFALFIVHFLGSSLTLFGNVFDHIVYEVPFPKPLAFAFAIGNVGISFILISLVLSRPLAHPPSGEPIIGSSTSPEDYTTLFGWITFSWVSPLIRIGTAKTLQEDDVWMMSKTMQAKPVFSRFEEIKGSLISRLWIANGRDLMLDFIGTVVSVFFNYCTPFFMKRIIDALDSPSPSPSSPPSTFSPNPARAKAYIFALAMFAAQLLKSEADVQHLWYGRRAAVRIRSELMSAIYDKALKRKDLAGVVGADVKKDSKSEADKKDGKRSKKDGKKEKEKDGKDDPKAGADIGKIVNLMAGDTTRLANTISGLYFLYGAPFEIAFASIFLYKLLGWSAFTGFATILVGWPINNFIARRSVRIQKGMLASRDKRMGIVNELLGALKFIKFFAWESKWIDRVNQARENELGWIKKSRANMLFFMTLWTSAPIAVSVISFASFVFQGGELSVGTAFTAISLFTMIRAPLNIIPTYIISIMQAHVALKRIETFLNEEEVDDQVSSLKSSDQSQRPTSHTNEDFGLKNAYLKWNSVKELEKEDSKSNKGKNGTNASNEIDVEADAGSNIEEVERVFELQDISVVFPEGALTLVTGPTASGKSALLLALLGEMTLESGELLMYKDISSVDSNGYAHGISYAAQIPWLQHLTIKDNILFGSPFDADRYDAVLSACALKPDLDVLEDGDETEIGARGISLSGGQKARVALARAVYSRSKIVLLDDPLSAIDSHTARIIFEQLLMGPLLRNRTVVLVTHHVELVLPGSEYLIRMLDGRIDLQGCVKDLKASGQLDIIALDNVTEEPNEDDKQATSEEDKKEEADVKSTNDADGSDNNKNGTTKTVIKKKARKLVSDEERETGGVKWSIYKTYLKASSYWTWVALTFFIICSQSLGFTEKFWIKIWGEAYGDTASIPTIQTHSFSSSLLFEQHSNALDTIMNHQHFSQLSISPSMNVTGIPDRLPSANEQPLFYVAVYSLIGVLSVVISISAAATQYTGALIASRRLFNRLLLSVTQTTCRWLDVTPTGRILNRFSKDIETIDGNLAGSLQFVNQSLATFLSSMIVVIAVFPPFLVPAVFFGIMYYKLAMGYLHTGRDLRRMESVTRSPIFSGFGELLEGIVTVRAFSAEARFKNNLLSKIDVTLNMWYQFWMTNRWLLIRYDCLGGLAVLTTSLFALSTNVDKPGWAGWAALCITSAMSFTNNIYWACRFWTQLELDLNSVERVVEYLELPQEPPAVIENSRPPAHWPSSSGPNEGTLVEVKGLEVRYAPELPAVLHDVSFTLKARERIGLLGRTGSGKSTLAMSILRFVDPAKGQIIIDGTDITSIGVQDLRSRLTFIPQDATLFSGTIRQNLDPFDEYSDIECLDALRRVHMIQDSADVSRTTSRAPSVLEVRKENTDDTAVETSSLLHPRLDSEATTIASDSASQRTTATGSIPITLDTNVSAGGLNFSAGQRQLIAMARALLRQSAVVVLDEATSSIDFKTDARIQQTIREEFGNSLLLTIAHRLRTVIDYDRLLVLDKGHVAEFDTPYNLIKKEGGIFRSMCLKSGNFTELEAAAKLKAAQDGTGV